jgi:hypothetical protein
MLGFRWRLTISAYILSPASTIFFEASLRDTILGAAARLLRAVFFRSGELDLAVLREAATRFFGVLFLRAVREDFFLFAI